jgi:hypothetical protein
MRPLLVPIAVALLAAALALGLWLGGGSDEASEGIFVPTPDVSSSPLDPSAPGPTAPEPASPDATAPDPSSVTVDDLVRRAEPDEDGRVELSVSGAELTSAANSEIPADAPVERVELELRSADDGRPRVDFSAGLRDQGLEVTGEVALGLDDGRVDPELLDARAGPLPLPGPFREPVEQVVRDAGRLFEELAAQGVDITELGVVDGSLHVQGRAEGISGNR